ncbi:hypothetical protein V1264_004656 [Littorina saxatilis]|uniref:Uncharacterized protein n=1 Tax=Littorina saxatilis TaxID=31220 RepID=A0AAN9AKB2_9CAEN
MSTKEDFLKWDDLPLEYIFGEFTEDDVKAVPNLKVTKSQAKRFFRLLHSVNVRLQRISSVPIAPTVNSYASISGFRRHVTKKHNKPHLKASEQHELTTVTPSLMQLQF